jgi:Asp/Glu/hydantoin racemase
MTRRLALVHTVVSLVPVFWDLCNELLASVNLFHLVDESLLQACIREGRLSPLTARRLAMHLVSAELAGADAALVTCSSLGPAVEIARPFLAIPVLRVDEPMAMQAVAMGQRIGVAATLLTTLDPTASLIQAKALALNKKVAVVSRLCEGAFDAMMAGDMALHDRLVGATLRALSTQVDVIVLAQASMACVAEMLPEVAAQVPVLSSPRLAVESLARLSALK